MVLSGTLREFILADVFQLLTQQKITGKLHLNNNVDEGVIVFKSGAIVNAFKGTECLESKLKNFLIDTNGINSTKTNAIFSAFKDDLQGLTQELVTQSLVTQDEVSALSESIIEDITCSMFLWNTGQYRFNSMRNVDQFIPANTLIPIENIVMEAMRRVDEWNRMQEQFNDDTIFALVKQTNDENNSSINPVIDPVNYLYQRINGISSIKELISTTPLTQYKVYESIYTLIQSQKIVPLSNEITQSVNAAIGKKEQDLKEHSISTFFSTVIVAGFILTVLLISSLFFKKILFSKIVINSEISRSELPQAIAEEKKSIAQIYFKSLGREDIANSDDSLLNFKLLSKDDLKYLDIRERIQK